MALANSSLAMAAESISQQLQAALADITVIVGTPMAAKTLSDTNGDKHYLNIFFYRIAPSGFHPAQTSDDPLFLRVAALLTPFPAKTIANPEPHAALRILGEVLRYFHEDPVGEVLPTGAANPQLRTPYRLEAALQAPTMEELNHIWTTQGSEIGYQMSAAYEFSLVPVDPLVAATPAGRVHTAQVQVGTDPSTPAGAQDYDLEFTAYPASDAGTPWPGAPHLPQLLVIGAEGPAGSTSLPATAAELDLALAGDPGTRAEVRLSIRDAAGTELRAVTGAFDIVTPRLDAASARVKLPVDLTGAASLVAEVREADATDAPLVPDRIGNTLTLTVTGGP